MRWYHSLYWRAAVGFVACLAVLLVVQAILFVWVVSQSDRTVPNQPPDRLAQTIAHDAAEALARDPSVDLEKYIRREYAKDTQPFVVLLATDSRAIEVGAGFPESVIEEARGRLQFMV